MGSSFTYRAVPLEVQGRADSSGPGHGSKQDPALGLGRTSLFPSRAYMPRAKRQCDELPDVRVVGDELESRADGLGEAVCSLRLARVEHAPVFIGSELLPRGHAADGRVQNLLRMPPTRSLGAAMCP